MYHLLTLCTAILRFIGNEVDKKCILQKQEQAQDLIGAGLATEEVRDHELVMNLIWNLVIASGACSTLR